MQQSDGALPQKRRRGALAVWWLCAVALVAPALFVLFTRTAALALGCEPDAGTCHTVLLGTAMRESLALAWLIGLHPFRALALAILAAGVALSLRKPIRASVGTLLMPLFAVTVPTAAVQTLLFPGCGEARIWGCSVFGASLGAAVHRASLAWGVIYGAAPYDFAAALMVAVIGFAFFRPRDRASGAHAMGSHFDGTAKSFHDPRD